MNVYPKRYKPASLYRAFKKAIDEAIEAEIPVYLIKRDGMSLLHEVEYYCDYVDYLMHGQTGFHHVWHHGCWCMTVTRRIAHDGRRRTFEFEISLELD